MILFAEFNRLVGRIQTPFGSFRTGDDSGFFSKDTECRLEKRVGPYWLQFVMKAPDYTELPEDPKEWRGRKWRVSAHSTEREVVGTAFAAVLAALEHEARESFKWCGITVFGPHIPLVALADGAEKYTPDARPSE